jgi:hypothetical protein
VDGCLLGWKADGGTAELTIGRVADPAGVRRERTTVRLEVVAHRMRISLSFLRIRKAVDLSVQPALFEHVLPVGRGPCRPGTAGSTAARWIASLAGTREVWRPPDPDAIGLVGVAGGASWPLLGAAYERGATPLGAVPPWATQILSKPILGEAAHAGFGAKANRRVTGALGSSLLELSGEADDPGPVSLYRLALALMGALVLEPDQIVRILNADGPRRSPDNWPDAAEIAAGSQLIARMAAAQGERLLIDAIERPDGPVLLSEILREVGSVLELLPERPAHRVEALRNQCRALLPVDPDPESAGWRRPPGAGSRRAQREGDQRGRATPVPAEPAADADEHLAAPRPRRTAQQRRRALLAPQGRAAVSGDPTRTAALSNLNGCDVGDGLRIAVPRSRAELSAWGQHLGNCVGSYAAAWASGLSLIIGVEVDEVLTYCLEVTPQGHVRQFLGARNRPVPRHQAEVICKRMAEAGVIDPTLTADRVWFR